jgi:hypothetical protein
MNDNRKSDSCIVPEKAANKSALAAEAELLEGRRLSKGNVVANDKHQTPSWIRLAGTQHIRRNEQRLKLILYSPSPPELGAGCGNSARPDLLRGFAAMRIPTPTLNSNLTQLQNGSAVTDFNKCVEQD